MTCQTLYAKVDLVSGQLRVDSFSTSHLVLIRQQCTAECLAADSRGSQDRLPCMNACMNKSHVYAVQIPQRARTTKSACCQYTATARRSAIATSETYRGDISQLDDVVLRYTVVECRLNTVLWRYQYHHDLAASGRCMD